MHFFFKFSTNFVDWNVEMGPQGNNVFSSMLRIEVLAVFQTSKKTKFQKFSSFTNFVQFLSKYR